MADREETAKPEIADSVAVLLPLPLAGAYDYAVPAHLTVRPGDVVSVPIGRNRRPAVVWGTACGEVAAEKLKSIEAVLPCPPMTDTMRRFVQWVSDYTLSPPGAVLRMALSVPDALYPPKPVTLYRLGREPAGLRMTPARQRIIGRLRDGATLDKATLTAETGTGAGVVKALSDAGVLAREQAAPEPPFATPDVSLAAPALSEEQRRAVAGLARDVKQAAFKVTVLDGVTGSGKTEVYFEAIAEAIAQHKQGLVLLPEISLSAQWLSRFERRFGALPAVWHSELTPATRRRTWRAVADGTARLVVGARSALFLPFSGLGLIVVDEEHEHAFKQEDGVSYQGRDMAVVRAQLSDCPVILASATPSLETTANVQAGKYHKAVLHRRHGTAELPEIKVVDLRKDRPGRQQWISPPLKEALRRTKEAGAQSLLFLNRRGYAPLTLCRSCGNRLQCPHCTAWLVEHRHCNRLQCHHCGFSTPLPPGCPECGAPDHFAACGPGVERLWEEVRDFMPDLRAEIISSETLTGPGKAADLARRMEGGEIDVLIGTQILAMGHHFPALITVGIVDADLGLSGGDLRAAERSYQLLQQVAGRAGRAERPGQVFVQTVMPDHPVIRALLSGDRDRFIAAELQARRQAGLPPFARMAALIVSGRNHAQAEAAAARLARSAPHGKAFRILGPAPAPLSLLRGHYRYRLLVIAERGIRLQTVLRPWVNAQKPPSTVRIKVDIDPYSFL